MEEPYMQGEIMYNILIGISLWLAAAFMAPSAFADHNMDLQGHHTERGYNRANCEALVSSTTGAPAEWLGHQIGCLIEEKRTFKARDKKGNPIIDKNGDVIMETKLGYVIGMEYTFLPISKKTGDELRELSKTIEKDPDITFVPRNKKGLTI